MTTTYTSSSTKLSKLKGSALSDDTYVVGIISKGLTLSGKSNGDTKTLSIKNSTLATLNSTFNQVTVTSQGKAMMPTITSKMLPFFLMQMAMVYEMKEKLKPPQMIAVDSC